MPIQHLLRGLTVVAVLTLAACTSTPLSTPSSSSAPVSTSTRSSSSKPLPVLPPAGSGRGGYYKDDGPGDNPPAGLLDTPDADPRVEPYQKGPNRPYVVFGKTYTPILDDRPFKQRGIGSWYGKKFHGQKTSSGELYDMYKMTAAHPTLPIPSYARVTNLKTGAQVIVRINDRGPFHSTRIIDLSYTAALKLGYLSSGSSELEVERLLPEEIERMAANKRNGISPAPVAAAAAADAADANVSLGSVAPQGQVTAVAMNTPANTSGNAAGNSAGNNAGNNAGNSAYGNSGISTGTAGAASAAAVAAPAAAATGTSSQAPVLAGGFYLQFGAYAQEANARTARDQLLQSLNGAVDKLEAISVNGLYRLFAGPYSSRAAAQDAAQLVRQRSNVTPFIVER